MWWTIFWLKRPFRSNQSSPILRLYVALERKKILSNGRKNTLPKFKAKVVRIRCEVEKISWNKYNSNNVFKVYQQGDCSVNFLSSITLSYELNILIFFSSEYSGNPCTFQPLFFKRLPPSGTARLLCQSCHVSLFGVVIDIWAINIYWTRYHYLDNGHCLKPLLRGSFTQTFFLA